MILFLYKEYYYIHRDDLRVYKKKCFISLLFENKLIYSKIKLFYNYVTLENICLYIYIYIYDLQISN